MHPTSTRRISLFMVYCDELNSLNRSFQLVFLDVCRGVVMNRRAGRDAFFFSFILLLFFGCESSKMQYDLVAIGDSITMGIQDAGNTTGYTNSSLPNNFMFDIVLRNLESSEKQTMLDHAVELNPRIILLWIGNNDILGAVLVGGGESLSSL